MKHRKLPSLSYKLYSTFIISFLIPMTLICIFLSYLFSSYQTREIQEQAANNTKLISAYLTRYINDIDNIMKSPYYHSYFQSGSDFKDLSISEQNQISEELGATLRMAKYSRDDFGDLLIISNLHVMYFNVENYYEYLGPLLVRNWYQAAIEKDGKIAITPGDPTSDTGEFNTMNFYISRKLNNLYDPEQENIIMVNMKNNALSSLFSELTVNIPYMVLFTNDQNELIYSNSTVGNDFLALLDNKKIHYQHETWEHSAQTLEKYPLTIHVLLSTSYITTQIKAFLFVSIICFAVGILIAYLLFHGNNQWIKFPVLHIQSVLRQMRHGDLNARCQALPVQEFDDIGSSVNKMAQKLQEKIKNEYELTIAQKNLQFQALSSQIRPHFIINTIYSFISLNQIGEQELLNDAFYSFARLLRYVLSKDNRTTIGKELDFLENYCMLHKLRFGPRITYQIRCDEGLHNFALPKLLLQPLVENAVIHGIEPSETPCFLYVSAEVHEENIYIIIEDNGVGFTKEQIESSSIGIKNVITRLELWDAGVDLSIYRIANQSIQIITIPKQLQGETHEHTDH